MSMELILANADVNLPQSIANLQQLKEELTPRLKKYNELVVTEDSIKAAKDDKAALNKLKKAIEEQRISIKKQYLEPYNILEAQCKEVVALIDAPIQAIDKQIKAIDEIEKKQKYEALEQAFAELNVPEWVTIADILNPKWENKTAKLDALKAEMAEKLKKINEDVTKIGEMYGDKPYHLPILNRYKTTKDFSQTAVYAVQLENEYKKEQERKAREEELRQQMLKAAEEKKAAESVQNAPEPPEENQGVIIPPEPQNAASVESEPTEPILKGKFAVECTKSQLIALRDFMKSQGIKFELIK
jgi:hypothetical protein